MATPGHLIVDIARMASGGEWLRGETGEGLLELDESDLLVPQGGIVYALKVELLGDELLVRGELRHHLKCVCSRCAECFESDVVEPDFVCALEINALTEFVDLTVEVREAIILALPGYPVCQTGCKGLCSTCGINLNRATCTCREKRQDDCWAALDTLS